MRYQAEEERKRRQTAARPEAEVKLIMCLATINCPGQVNTLAGDQVQISLTSLSSGEFVCQGDAQTLTAFLGTLRAFLTPLELATLLADQGFEIRPDPRTIRESLRKTQSSYMFDRDGKVCKVTHFERS
jgi:hypothetical protein